MLSVFVAVGATREFMIGIILLVRPQQEEESGILTVRRMYLHMSAGERLF